MHRSIAMTAFDIPTRAAIGLVAAALAGATLAADPAAPPGARDRYAQERARCLNGQSHQDRETCLREAGAALQTAREGRGEDAPSELAKNGTRRCDVHTLPADREECVRRMQMGTTQGSVEGGGMVRELRTVQGGD
jgi:hypothetical protein